MKISSASKKVLASALSAAMVVAFAPTVAFATNLGTDTDSSASATGEAVVQVQWKDGSADKVTKFSNDEKGVQEALDFAAEKSGTIKLLSNISGDFDLHGKVTLDLNGFTVTGAGKNTAVESTDKAYKETNNVGPLTVAAAKAAKTVGTSKLVKMTKADYDNGQLTSGVYFKAVSFNAAADAGTYTYVTEDLEDKVKLSNADTTKDIVVKAGDMLKGYDAAAKTCSDRKTAGSSNTIADGSSVVCDGKYYIATVVSSAIDFDQDVDYYKAIAGTEKTGALSAGDVTIKDSSEAKTGKVDGNEVDKSADDEVAVAMPAVKVVSGAKLTVKGGTFSTGAATTAFNSESAVVKAIDGEVESLENATVEAVAGTYKDTDNNETLGVAAEGVTVKGAVKKSAVKATAPDYGTATALIAKGSVEETTVEATAGAGAFHKHGDTDKQHAATATAIDAQGTSAVTYKKVTATATANGSNEVTKAEGTDTVIGTPSAIKTASSTGTVTVNSGSFTGERATTQAPVTVHGGQWSKHIQVATNGADADSTVNFGTEYGTVCLGEGKSDWVYTKSDATVNGSDTIAEGYEAYKSAVDTAIDHVYAAAISGENPYEVGYALATGYDAAKLAAAVTDADEATKLYEDVQVAGGAQAVKATAPKVLTAGEQAFNAVVEGVDKAAAAESKKAFGYMNVTAGVTYKASASAVSSTDVLSLSDLGKVAESNTSGNHSSATTTTLKANAIELDANGVAETFGAADYIKNNGGALVTSTKSPADVVSLGGDKLTVVSADAKTKKFGLTKLGGYGIVASNGQTATDKADDKPAAEKATQGIDVAKKSKTVKLAKGAKKTKKAQSFKMGASAETAVTTAKKSGSSKVTVSKSGKVTLKKGAKKGTYTAKVTIKAAASEQYAAATKTVTVKFVVKK